MGFLFSWGRRTCACYPGYETDERGSLGERADRRRGREEEGERVAAVGKKQARFAGRRFCRAPQQGRYAKPTFTVVRHKGKYRVLPPQPYRVFITDLTVVDTRFLFLKILCSILRQFILIC